MINQSLLLGYVYSPVGGQDTEGGITPGRKLILQLDSTTDAIKALSGDYLIQLN